MHFFTNLLIVCVCFRNEVTGAQTPYKACAGAKSKAPVELDYAGCESSPCIIKKGVKLPLVMKFKAPMDVVELKQNANVQVLGRKMPAPGDDGKMVCEFIHDLDGNSVGCPLKKDTEYLFKYTVYVNPNTPKVNMVFPAHWALVDTTTKKEIPDMCFEINMKFG